MSHQLWLVALFCCILVRKSVCGELGTRTARPRRRRGNQSPSRALIRARVPTVRNVYQGCTNPILYEKRFGYFFVYRRFCGESTQNGKRAKAGYHRGDGILPFVLICFISRSQHPLQYSLRENSP